MVHCCWPSLTLAANLFCSLFLLWLVFCCKDCVDHRPLTLYGQVLRPHFWPNLVDCFRWRWRCPSSLRSAEFFCGTTSRRLHRLATLFMPPEGRIESSGKLNISLWYYFSVGFPILLVSFIKSPSSIKFVDMVLSVSALLIFRGYIFCYFPLLCIHFFFRYWHEIIVFNKKLSAGFKVETCAISFKWKRANIKSLIRSVVPRPFANACHVSIVSIGCVCVCGHVGVGAYVSACPLSFMSRVCKQTCRKINIKIYTWQKDSNTYLHCIDRSIQVSVYREWIRGRSKPSRVQSSTVMGRTNANKCADINVVIIMLANTGKDKGQQAQMNCIE